MPEYRSPRVIFTFFPLHNTFEYATGTQTLQAVSEGTVTVMAPKTLKRKNIIHQRDSVD